MSTLAVINARLVLADGVRQGALSVRDGIIEAVVTDGEPLAGDETLDAGGRYVAPGLIDIHVHGGGGFNLMTDDVEQVRGYARWIVSRGVTGFLVSTSGRDHAEIRRRLEALRSVVGARFNGARVLGIHLEGPYINPVRKGAFDPRWLRPPNADEYRELFEASGGTVRQVTFAPELPGAEALLGAIVASGATAAIGHTDATYDEALHAFARGATHVTHAFNAMRPFGHRDPGCVAAILTSDGVTAELIGDGAHVDYAAARVLLRAMSPRNIVLVTDGMPMAGTAGGETEWEGVAIRVEGGRAVRVRDGTIVGGVITLDQTVRNAVEHLGVPLNQAAAMASANPARVLRLDGRCGALRPGCAADFVLLDDALTPVATHVAGENVWLAGGRP